MVSIGSVLFGLTVMVVVTVSLIVTFSLAVSALLFSRRKGRFKLIRHRGEAYAFSTDYGLFRPDAAAGKLRVAGKGGVRSEFPIEELRGLTLGVAEESALLTEFALGFDLTDLLGRYRDSWQWTSVTLGLGGGASLPVFVVGQYQRREFLMNWWYELQKRILARVGLFRDAESYAREVHTAIRDILRRAGARL